MRDIRKDMKYFEEFIAYQNDRISKKTEKLNGCQVDDAAKIKRINMSLLNFKMDLFIASFSNGDSEENLNRMFDDMVETAISKDNIDYETLLRMLSIAIMLENDSTGKKVAKVFGKQIEKDKLLNCLATFCNKHVISWNGTFVIRNIYDKLDVLFDENNNEMKEKKMLEYLECWYQNHSDSSWYDTHKSNNDTYCGYWCFESAAVARVLKLDDRLLCRNQYFPLV